MWNQATVGLLSNTAPFEGSNVIAWNYNSANQWFGGSIQSRQVHDMSGFLQR
ncbi:hypothetical protein LP420_04020 [Massilia sp. B-10]|nr:hypothetical protein LP420_04020 [Massilia sp. B-10]